MKSEGKPSHSKIRPRANCPIWAKIAPCPQPLPCCCLPRCQSANRPTCPRAMTTRRPPACTTSLSPIRGTARAEIGDRGVILHTDDGGEHWSRQESGVVCTLRTVSFVDARTGWAAGGMAWPFLHDSSGVVLCTYDGGRTWQREPVLMPAIRKMRFVSDRQGWAVADTSAMYPSAGPAERRRVEGRPGSRPAKAARAA